MDCAVRKIHIRMVVMSLFLVIGGLYAGTQQETFLQAQKHYQEGNTTKALELYQSMPHKGMSVFYNMGNCYYMQKNFPQAVVYWSRAQKDSSLSEYKILQSYIQQAYKEAGVPYNMTGWRNVYNMIMYATTYVSLVVWQVLLLICWFLLVFRSNFWVRWRRYGRLTIVGVTFALLIGVNYVNYRNYSYPKVIVTKKSISVYAGPGADYAVVGTAQLFDNLRTYRTTLGWYMVYVDHIGYGWVNEENCMII